MATTKRKRRSTKHKGNAAGMVEVRGRTSRPRDGAPRPGARKDPKQMTTQERRLARLETPPSWRSAVTKAGIAAVVFAVAVILLFQRPVASGIGLALFTFVLYVPLSYYTDMFVYRRHQRRKLQKAA